MSADERDTTRTQETDFAALWSSDGVTRSLASTGAIVPSDLPFLFSAGQRFGPYLIVRPLGKGGMGQVYEAEEIESGRRVAVKLLSRGLGDDEERERFLREGQLAASLSHPNVVYIFGTSEVQGFPVIAMELAPAGTLKDLVDPAAPMTVAAAVDAVLQVIAGLDAAAAIGILHRDVKPSNCFLDRDGRVMVGDFGLSIASGGATVEHAVLGTPGFASPEQLRGAALDVRSDIYSVGATLYYLLTGRTPFDTSDLQTLMTRIGGETAPVVTAARPDVPGRFGSVVAKCLATKPADRYANYAALSAALEPFRTTALVPAPLGRRFAAGFIDSYAASLPLMPLNVVLGQRMLTAERDGEFFVLLLPSIVSSVLYYTILEGRFGWSAGKAALNLRVVDESQHAPGFERALLRSLAFILPSQILVQGASFAVMRSVGSTSVSVDPSTASTAGLAVIAITFIWLALLFIPARRRNGYAAFHDRASRTRVVVRPSSIEARQATCGKESKLDPNAFGPHRIGPYLVEPAAVTAAQQLTGGTVVIGYDDRLRRAVWIELLPLGTAAVPEWRRDLNRPGRARWITGRRSDRECWDAYERIDGEAFTSAIATPQPWSRIRHWVADIAREVAAASRDGSLPSLRHDRVWISRDDRARLLDLAPGPVPSDAIAEEPNPQTFLYGLAVGALGGTSPVAAAARGPDAPLPGGARSLLLALRDGTAGTADNVAARSDALLRQAAVFPRRRRLMQLAVCAALPVVMVVAVFTVLRMQLRARTADPAAYALKACLNRIDAIDRKGAAATASDLEQRDLLEIYIAERLREPAEETASYARAFPAIANVQREYRLAERALQRHPNRTAEQIARAATIVAPVIERNTESLEHLNQPLSLLGVLGLVGGGALAFVAMLGVIGALVTRSGFLLHGLGAMLVTATGVPVTRGRAVARALVTWSPIALWVVIVNQAPSNPEHTSPAIALGYAAIFAIVVAAALYAWRRPARAIQDRIAGTWIVPR